MIDSQARRDEARGSRAVVVDISRIAGTKFNRTLVSI